MAELVVMMMIVEMVYARRDDLAESRGWEDMEGEGGGGGDRFAV